MPLEIRPATADDAGIVHRFIRELAEYEHEPEAVEATPDSLRAHMSEAAPPFECLIAQKHGEPVGFALFFQNYSTWKGRRGIWLEDLYVSPPHRRCGVGLALFQAVARVAEDRACGRLEWAVLDWNQTAIDFYRSLGAQPQSEWTILRLTGTAISKIARAAAMHGAAESKAK